MAAKSGRRELPFIPMDELLAARSLMALSLGFHIIFACVGMTMPFLMAIAHYRYLRTGSQVFQDLTQAWLRGVAIFFATGAVSGTVLSFELGLLWPKFMLHAGPIFGMPFSWEGAAFFIEAIALGLFLYGRNRMQPWVHWSVGVVVGISGVLSGIFVVCANAWMNAPAGFDWVNGQAVNIDPFAAMFNPAWKTQTLHMTISAFQATGFAVAGVHAFMLLRRPSLFHFEAFKIALLVGAVAALIQPLSGDILAKGTAVRQPIKLAAMESHFETAARAPLILGGIPDAETESVRYGIELPGMLSFLAFGDVDAEVKGLKDFPREEWPPLKPVHFAFQIMVGAGSAMAALGGLYLLMMAVPRWRSLPKTRPFLWACALSAPLGFIAVEAGWVVTEVGRQPWIIYGVMRTADAVTPAPGLWIHFFIYAGVYLLLALLVTGLMVRHIRSVPNKYASGRQDSWIHETWTRESWARKS
jgi:cytochrome d ubiquinol oxidase subunit I